MIRIIKTLVLFGLLSSLSIKGFSQMSISYYSSSLSKFGLGYNFSDKLWGEIRLYSNTIIDDVTPEFVVCYNIAKKKKHNVYLGLGGNVNYLTGLVLPIGIQFTPIEKFNRFSLQIELQSTLDFDSDLLDQSFLGLRYIFGGKE